jgi:formylglycine-generating enzyme required for sulfatase activity
LLRLLEAEGTRYLGRWEELKYLLAPFVARDAAEQQHFYELFDAFVAECEAEVLTPPPDPPSWWRPHARLIGYTAGTLLLIVALALGLDHWLKQVPETIRLRIAPPTSLQVAEGSTVELHPETPLLPMDSSGLVWGVSYQGQNGQHRDSFLAGPSLAWPAGWRGSRVAVVLRSQDTLRFKASDTLRLQVICAERPLLRAVDLTPSPTDTMLVQNREYRFAWQAAQPGDSIFWRFPDGTQEQGATVRYTFQQAAAEASIILRVQRGPDCVAEQRFTYRLGRDQPFVPLLTYQPAKPKLHHQYNHWYWLLVLLPLLAMPWLLRRWYRKFQPRQTRALPQLELEDKYPIPDLEPYELPYRDQRGQISVPADFYRMADVLRRREIGNRRTFDPDASVRATVRRGGYASYREKGLSRPVSYLILVQRHDERHQQDRLLARLVDFLHSQDAPVEIFWHEGAFQRAWAKPGEGMPMGQLRRQYPQHRLIILGDAHGLVSQGPGPEPNLVKSRLQPLLGWSRRLILTPEPAQDWAWQEGLLHAHFLLYPLTTAGILAGLEDLDQTEEYLPGDFLLARAHARQQFPEESARFVPLGSVEALRDWLADDPDLWRWLGGLAVAARPDWSLSIAIGRALGVAVTHDRLLRLSRISWLAENRPATALRLDLLRQADPADLRLARETMLAELEAIKAQVAGSFAELELRSSEAVQHFALDPRDPGHKQAIRELQDYGLIPLEQVAELEYIVAEQADGEGLPATAKRSLQDWLNTPEPGRWRSWELGAMLLILLLSLGGAWWGWSVAEVPLPGEAQYFWEKTIQPPDEAVELHNQAIAIAARRDSLSHWTDWRDREDSLQYALALLTQAQALQSTYSLRLDSSYFELLYNHRARAFNFFLADSATLGADLRNLRIAGDTIGSLQPPSPAPYALATLHLRGLYNFYVAEELAAQQDVGPLRDTTEAVYDQLMALSGGRFFDSLRASMPVNLQTLLRKAQAERPYDLLAQLLDAKTGAPVVGAQLSGPNGLRLQSDSNGLVRRRFIGVPATDTLALQLTAAGYRARRYAFVLRPTASQPQVIRVQPLPPGGLRAELSDTVGCVALQVTASALADKPIERYEWAIDGERLTGFTWTRTFDLGIYRVGLAVLFADGSRDTLRDLPPIRVVDPPVAEIELAVDEAQAGRYRFDAIRSRDITAYRWDLGDGNQATGPSVVHTYATSGDYRVRLTVEDGICVDSAQTFVSVEAYSAADIPLPTMLRIPGGSFQMGSTEYAEEQPVHSVTVADFSLSETEVTHTQFAAFLNAKGNQEEGGISWYDESGSGYNGYAGAAIQQEAKGIWVVKAGREDHPVNYVSWHGARAYCQWLSEKTGQRYRLPTEAEWEYAAGGGTVDRDILGNRRFIYAGSDELDEVGWYASNINNTGTRPVRQKKANALGLYDMSGNVWEWCADWYGYYPSQPQTNPTGPSDGAYRVYRGGSWDGDAEFCRVADRDGYTPDSRHHDLGFRLAR